MDDLSLFCAFTQYFTLSLLKSIRIHLTVGKKLLGWEHSISLYLLPFVCKTDKQFPQNILELYQCYKKIISLCCHRLYKGHPNSLSWTLLNNISLKKLSNPSQCWWHITVFAVVCMQDVQTICSTSLFQMSLNTHIDKEEVVWTRSVKKQNFQIHSSVGKQGISLYLLPFVCKTYKQFVLNCRLSPDTKEHLLHPNTHGNKKILHSDSSIHELVKVFLWGKVILWIPFS